VSPPPLGPTVNPLPCVEFPRPKVKFAAPSVRDLSATRARIVNGDRRPAELRRLGRAAENPLRFSLSAVVDRALSQPCPRSAAQGPSSVSLEQDRPLGR